MHKPQNANELLHEPIEPTKRTEATMSFLAAERPASARGTRKGLPLALAMLVLLLLAVVTLLLATRVISAGPY